MMRGLTQKPGGFRVVSVFNKDDGGSKSVTVALGGKRKNSLSALHGAEARRRNAGEKTRRLKWKRGTKRKRRKLYG